MNTELKLIKKLLTEKYKQSKLSDFSDDEILKLLLSYSGISNSFPETAEALIKEYGSINVLMDADINMLMKNKDIDEKVAVLLKIIPQLSRIISLESEKIVCLSSSQIAMEYFRRYFIGASEELLAMVCTDEKLNITAEKTLCCGSAIAVSTYCRKIVEFALKNNSSHIFIAHNHPIGSAEPSASDLRSTGIICRTLENIGISLVDHIIIAKDSAISIKELPHTVIFGDDSSCRYIFNCQ